MTPEELKRKRQAKGWSQLELARRLGVARNTVVRWEHGTRKISTMTSVAIRSVLRTR